MVICEIQVVYCKVCVDEEAASNWRMDFAGKLLLMLQSVKRGLAVEPDNPQLHECLVQFLNTGMLTNRSIC
jgi:hypothetical protein